MTGREDGLARSLSAHIAISCPAPLPTNSPTRSRTVTVSPGFEYALRSATARDGIGHMWVRFPDIEPVLNHPRYAEILAAMGA
jgi:hypothetical protein